MIRAAALRRLLVAATLFCVATAAQTAQAQLVRFPLVDPGANTFGDQLIFFYDARPSRASFLTVGNPAGVGVVLEVAFYSQTLERLAEQVFVLPPGGARVVDPGTVANVSNTAGLAFVTPIAGEQDHSPVVPNRPLVGGFTIVNTALGAGTGGN